MDESTDSVEAVDLTAMRWRDAGALLAMLDPELFESMVRSAEVTAVALSTARKKSIG